jgi:hypothetical protein
LKWGVIYVENHPGGLNMVWVIIGGSRIANSGVRLLLGRFVIEK